MSITPVALRAASVSEQQCGASLNPPRKSRLSCDIIPGKPPHAASVSERQCGTSQNPLISFNSYGVLACDTPYETTLSYSRPRQRDPAKFSFTVWRDLRKDSYKIGCVTRDTRVEGNTTVDNVGTRHNIEKQFNMAGILQHTKQLRLFVAPIFREA
ncbi:hypothetical protein K438DRAFT_1761597 [Mycena galopus ATCC 62051]|nr:hypothetical protein K438DRAFT_1761597 [Mycena galopus ATCC 62051]